MATRDRLRRRASALHQTQAEVLDDLLDRVEHDAFLAELATYEPDEGYLREMREWDSADLGGSSE